MRCGFCVNCLLSALVQFSCDALLRDLAQQLDPSAGPTGNDCIVREVAISELERLDMSAAATSATGVSSGRLDMLGGVADYSGSTVLEVATRVTTTANAKLVADSGDKGFAVLRSTPFGECKLPLDGLRDTTKIDHAAVRATLKDAGAPLWAHYVFGCVAVFAKHTGWLPAADAALEVDIHSDVPTAQGCSSSASVRARARRGATFLQAMCAPLAEVTATAPQSSLCACRWSARRCGPSARCQAHLRPTSNWRTGARRPKTTSSARPAASWTRWALAAALAG